MRDTNVWDTLAQSYRQLLSHLPAGDFRLTEREGVHLCIYQKNGQPPPMQDDCRNSDVSYEQIGAYWNLRFSSRAMANAISSVWDGSRIEPMQWEEEWDADFDLSPIPYGLRRLQMELWTMRTKAQQGAPCWESEDPDEQELLWRILSLPAWSHSQRKRKAEELAKRCVNMLNGRVLRDEKNKTWFWLCMLAEELLFTFQA